MGIVNLKNCRGYLEKTSKFRVVNYAEFSTVLAEAVKELNEKIIRRRI